MFKVSVSNELGDQCNFQLETKTFSGGEENIVLTPDCLESFMKVLINGKPSFFITTFIKSSSDLMKLLLIKNSLDNIALEYYQSSIPCSLLMPYIPYARQDRICNKGEAFSLKVFANILNSCNFSHVIVDHPHSNVSIALINNITTIKKPFISYDTIIQCLKDERNVTFVAPDQGAVKMVQKFSYVFATKGTNDKTINIVVGDKQRDLKTGEIISHTINGDVNGKYCVILDDIVDGGRTFVSLAKILKEKGAKTIDLITTFGILPYGIKALKEAGINDIIVGYDMSKNNDLEKQGVLVFNNDWFL